jgi:N-methylhydantoinase A/oxoprolinase/acetone carboxylase beta subunit
LLDLAKKGTSSVVSANKSPTTVDVTDGIESTLTNLLLNPASFQVDGSVTTTPIDRKSISALTIGTTHFINAIVQRKATLLSRVAVIRLGSHGFVDSPLPFADWPPSLRKIIEGYSAVVPGGVNIDGKLIAGIDEHLLRQQARTIYEAGLRHVVIVGTGSPMDQTYDQEAEAKRFILSEMVALDAKYAEGVEFVLSHMVAGPGLLMRENASILNAAILTFARRTIHSIILATRKVGLACPVYFTSNAGHLLPYNEAMDFPVNIFSSGATNSMRGAAFLAQDAISTSSAQSSVVVIDVGGTTSDAGALLPNGYPRLSSIFNSLAGVKVNLQMPSVESIGLGGGSIIRADESRGLAVGPDSVGHAITTEALCCGGKTPTATDVAILSSPKPSVSISIGDSSLVNLPPDFITASRSRIKQMLESLVDRIKLSPEDCTVILVGGGAFICPSELEGVGKIILPKHAGVANAIGAALAKIHGSSEAIVDSDDIQEGISKVMDAAIQNAVSKGAIQDEVIVLNETIEWVPYVEKKQKVHIDVACDADHARVYSEMIESTKEIDYDIGNTDDHEAANTAQVNIDVSQTIEDDEKVDLSAYRPEVSSSGHWTISPIDLKFLEIGCYILGCGGGGSPHATYLGLLELLRLGEQIVLIDPESLSDDASLPPIAAIGTPAVGLERISSDAVWHAIERLERELGVKTTHMLAIEIGGMNGLATLRWAAKRYCHVPVVDGDLMGKTPLVPESWANTNCMSSGRAYPNFEMVSQYVHADNIDALLPVAICSGDGRESIIPKGQKDETSAGMEIRKVCTEYGYSLSLHTHYA